MLYLQSIGGFVLLFAGGEFLVRGAVALARRAGISPLLIGMTIVAAATSAPELVVSLDAASAGQSDIAVGNIVGSNIANVLLILGGAALIAPIVVNRLAIRRDALVTVAATAALVLVAIDGGVSRAEGVLFILALVAYTAVSYWLESRRGSPAAALHEGESEQLVALPQGLPLALLALALGLGALLVGAQLLLAGSTGLARSWGIPEAIIGLTVVAVGTSLPELATSLAAAARGQSDIAVGNVLGSNLFNILGILGVVSVVRPVSVATGIAGFDIPVALGALLLVVLLLLMRGRIPRLAGAGLLLLYLAYAAWSYLG